MWSTKDEFEDKECDFIYSFMLFTLKMDTHGRVTLTVEKGGYFRKNPDWWRPENLSH